MNSSIMCLYYFLVIGARCVRLLMKSSTASSNFLLLCFVFLLTPPPFFWKAEPPFLFLNGDISRIGFPVQSEPVVSASFRRSSDITFSKFKLLKFEIETIRIWTLIMSWNNLAGHCCDCGSLYVGSLSAGGSTKMRCLKSVVSLRVAPYYRSKILREYRIMKF